MEKIYMDYAATTPMDKEVKKAMEPYFGGQFGNPNSLHYFGRQARNAIDISRQKEAELIGADFNEIIFTGSATEANNLVLRGIVKHAIQNVQIHSNASNLKYSNKFAVLNRFKIIISSIEHDSVLETAKDLEGEGVEVVILPVNKNGIVDLKKIKENLDERTILVSIMYANNEIGSIQPISKISEIVENFRSENKTVYPLLHTDAVQAFQFLECDVNNLGIDMMTLSAHKIYGPKGAGLLYKRSFDKKISNQLINSIITGGGQEFGLRSGTENTAGIVGMAKAIELANKNREKESKKIGEFKKHFLKELKKIYPKIEINGSEKSSLPNIANIYFPGKRAEDLLIKLDMAGVAVSSGSACASFAAKTSHVLEALGCSENRVKESLRFSFGKFTDKNELKSVLKILKNILK